MKLNATIEINGINPYVLVSSSLATSLKPNWRKPIPVKIRVNGQPKDFWHINMVPKGDGEYYLYLHNDVRKASSTKVGDCVEVEILLDEAYKNGPQHDMPEALAHFLNSHKEALANWESLPPSRQKEVLRYLAGVKSVEAKQRNIDKTIQALSGEPIRFMGRDWQSGH